MSQGGSGKAEVGSPEGSLADHWLRAAARETIATALEGVYADAAAAIASRGPACWASGRCCNFEKTGHRLYVTGLEAAYCLAKLPTVSAGPALTPSLRSGLSVTPRLSLNVLGEAKRRGGCPFQVANLCGVHAIKPLGCRVYFCDRSAQEWQRELSERLLARVRAIHDEHGVAYRYGEWREMLARFAV